MQVYARGCWKLAGQTIERMITGERERELRGACGSGHIKKLC